jgi:hypothetical protein
MAPRCLRVACQLVDRIARYTSGRLDGVFATLATNTLSPAMAKLSQPVFFLDFLNKRMQAAIWSHYGSLPTIS